MGLAQQSQDNVFRKAKNPSTYQHSPPPENQPIDKNNKKKFQQHVSFNTFFRLLYIVRCLIKEYVKQIKQRNVKSLYFLPLDVPFLPFHGYYIIEDKFIG